MDTSASGFIYRKTSLQTLKNNLGKICKKFTFASVNFPVDMVLLKRKNMTKDYLEIMQGGWFRWTLQVRWRELLFRFPMIS
jgi:hypothetical protein